MLLFSERSSGMLDGLCVKIGAVKDADSIDIDLFYAEGTLLVRFTVAKSCLVKYRKVCVISRLDIASVLY